MKTVRCVWQMKLRKLAIYCTKDLLVLVPGTIGHLQSSYRVHALSAVGAVLAAHKGLTVYYVIMAIIFWLIGALQNPKLDM